MEINIRIENYIPRKYHNQVWVLNYTLGCGGIYIKMVGSRKDCSTEISGIVGRWKLKK